MTTMRRSLNLSSTLAWNPLLKPVAPTESVMAMQSRVFFFFFLSVRSVRPWNPLGLMLLIMPADFGDMETDPTAQEAISPAANPV